MKKFVVYHLSDHRIAYLTDERPRLECLPSHLDFDTCDNWNAFEPYATRLSNFILKSSNNIYQ